MTEKDVSNSELNLDDSLSDNNIFEELSWSEELKQEMSNNEEKSKKNTFYYLKKANTFFIPLNTLFLIWVMLFFWFYYFQISSSQSYSFLSPICSNLISEHNNSGNCYGVSYLLENKKNELSEIEKNQANSITPIFTDAFAKNNFHLSRKMTFLLDTSVNRLRPIEIISEFDTLKNMYASVDKSEITCFDIQISEDNMLSLSCDVFSSDWDKNIVIFEDGIKTNKSGWGTSITKAASFIDFIKFYDESPFTVLEQDDNFSSVAVQIPPYTQKTTIDLELQYNTLHIKN